MTGQTGRMTTPDPTPQPERTCCGEQRAGTWLPKAGEPQVHACKLCLKSGRHWDGEA